MDTANCRQSKECFDDKEIPVADALISKRIFCTDNFVKNGKVCKKLSATNEKKCVKRKGSKVKTDPSKRCKSGFPKSCSSKSLQTSDGADKKNLKGLFVNLDNTLRKFFNHLAASSQSSPKVPYPNISNISCKYYKEEVSLRVDVDGMQQTDLNIADSLKACSSVMMLIQTHQPDDKSAGSAIHRNEKACHHGDSSNSVGKNVKSGQKNVKSTLEAEMPASVLNCATKIQPHKLDNARSSVNVQNTIMHKEQSTQIVEKLVLGEVITDFERAISLSHRPVLKRKMKQNVKDFSRCTSGQVVQTIQSSQNLTLEKKNREKTDSMSVTRGNIYKKLASLSENPTSKTVQSILKKTGHKKTNNPNLIGDTINIQSHIQVSCDGNINRLSPKKGEASMLQLASEAVKTVAGENCLETSLAAASIVSVPTPVPSTHTQLHSVDCAGNQQHSSCEKSDVSDDLTHQTLQIAGKYLSGQHLLCSANVQFPTKTLSHVSTLSHNSSETSLPSGQVAFTEMLNRGSQEIHSYASCDGELRMHTSNRPESGTNIAFKSSSMTLKLSSSNSNGAGCRLKKINIDETTYLSSSNVNSGMESSPKAHMASARTFSKVLQEDHFMDVALEIEVLENSETKLTAEFAPMKQGHHQLLHDNDIAKHSSSLPQISMEELPNAQGETGGLSLCEKVDHPKHQKDEQHNTKSVSCHQQLSTHQVCYEKPNWNMLESFIQVKDPHKAHEMFRWLEKLQKNHQLKRIPTKILKSLMNMYMKRKAVPQLLHILLAVCHHRLFDLSVCRTYIQLCRKYPVYLKQIFKALKANNLRPAAVDISVLLKAFLQDIASTHQLWEVLCYCSLYQDAPLELVEKAIGQTQTVISNRNIVKLVNSWVMTAPSSLFCKLKPKTLLQLQAFLHQEPARCLQQALQQAQGFDLDLAVRFLAQIQNKEEDPLFISHLSDVLLRNDVLQNTATFLSSLEEKINKGSRHMEKSVSCIRLHLSRLGSLLLAGCCGQQGDDVTEKLLHLLKTCPLVDKPQLTSCCLAHSKTLDQLLEGKQKVSDYLQLDRSATTTEPGHDHIQSLLQQQPSASSAASSHPQQVVLPDLKSGGAGWCCPPALPQLLPFPSFAGLPPLPSDPPPLPPPPPPPLLPPCTPGENKGAFLQLPHEVFQSQPPPPIPWQHYLPAVPYAFGLPPQRHDTMPAWSRQWEETEELWQGRRQWPHRGRMWKRGKRSYYDSRGWRKNRYENVPLQPGGW